MSGRLGGETRAVRANESEAMLSCLYRRTTVRARVPSGRLITLKLTQRTRIISVSGADRDSDVAAMLALSFADSILPQDESQRRRDAVLTGGLTSAKQRQDLPTRVNR